MELTELMSLNRSQLISCWQETFGVAAPKQCGQELMRQALGWEIQARVHGGHTAASRKQLRQRPTTKLSTGSKLIRVWQGETHQVDIRPEGFLYKGQTWKSLSAIAKEITGTHWSGPVFFGLKK